ncbi:MAG: GIY-YIG nuclease family protein [Nitrososphaerota archaeon]|nr:GIY-YIG nuclease family protein [Nitrososphaerota archaeon]
MKGVYVLLIRASENVSIQIGSLGRVSFKKGIYGYVGSAQSSLFPRLKRHFAMTKKLHWHIDFLTTAKSARVERAIYAAANGKTFECLLGRRLSSLSFSKPVPNFGSTDCKRGCGAHLFQFQATTKEAVSAIVECLVHLGLEPQAYGRVTSLSAAGSM